MKKYIRILFLAFGLFVNAQTFETVFEDNTYHGCCCIKIRSNFHQLSTLARTLSEVILNFPEYREIYLDIINQQREWLISKNREEILLDEEIVRKHLKMLDLQEEKLGMH